MKRTDQTTAQAMVEEINTLRNTIGIIINAIGTIDNHETDILAPHALHLAVEEGPKNSFLNGEIAFSPHKGQLYIRHFFRRTILLSSSFFLINSLVNLSHNKIKNKEINK